VQRVPFHEPAGDVDALRAAPGLHGSPVALRPHALPDGRHGPRGPRGGGGRVQERALLRAALRRAGTG
jgi:hypothetical protein